MYWETISVHLSAATLPCKMKK